MISALMMERATDTNNDRHCLCFVAWLFIRSSKAKLLLFLRTPILQIRFDFHFYASEKKRALSNLAPHKFEQNRDDLSFAIFSSRYRRSFSAICCFTGPICNDKNNHHLPREQTTVRHNYYCPFALFAMQSRAMRQLHFACSKVKVCGHVRHAPLPPNCFLLTRNSHKGPP